MTGPELLDLAAQARMWIAAHADGRTWRDDANEAEDDPTVWALRMVTDALPIVAALASLAVDVADVRGGDVPPARLPPVRHLAAIDALCAVAHRLRRPEPTVDTAAAAVDELIEILRAFRHTETASAAAAPGWVD